jgi:hypothetical protein
MAISPALPALATISECDSTAAQKAARKMSSFQDNALAEAELGGRAKFHPG